MNKKMMRTFVICVLTFPLFTLAACHHHGEQRHSDYADSGRLTSHIVDELELNSGQETQLRELLSNFEEKRRALGKRDKLKNIFVAQLKNKELDEEYLRHETSELIRELETASAKFITDLSSFHASLSEEQRGKLVNIISREKG